jgi:hypothetical protein
MERGPPVAFKSYNDRLKEQVLRRNAALAQIKYDSTTVQLAVEDKVTETKDAITCKIDEAKGAVTERIDVAKRKVTEKIDYARQTVTEKIEAARTTFDDKMTSARETFAQKYDDFKTTVNPATHIDNNPWQWSLGALAAGMLAAPALKAMFTGKPMIKRRKRMEPEPRQAADYEESSYASGYSTSGKQTALQPLFDAFLPIAVEYARKTLKLDPVPQNTEENEVDAQAYFNKSIARKTAPPPRES